jgi:cyclopropane-fatty-acyl-phospholipid synthase
LARFAAENHGCEVVGITISEQQKAYADRYCEGLPVDIRLQDYRDIDGEFDAICSVGMLEHVGSRNYDTYMDAASGSLRDGGLFLCHTITANEARRRPDPWISRYIFMNSELPTAAQVLQAAEGYFVNEDMHNLGPYYVPTLRAWEAGFMRSRDDFRIEYGEQFVRMWRFYLLSCSGAFRARSLQVIQFLFSRGGLETPEPVRIC